MLLKIFVLAVLIVANIIILNLSPYHTWTYTTLRNSINVLPQRLREWNQRFMNGQLPEVENGYKYNISDMNPWIFDPKLAQNDSLLVAFTAKHFLVPPSTLDYNLTNPHGDPASKEKQHLYALKFLKGKEKGFFIECGATDGEYVSSTLVLERDHRWSGLLIEPDPSNHPILLSKHRKAWISPVCLSTVPYPQQVTFIHVDHKNWTGLNSFEIKSKLMYNISTPGSKLVSATCFTFVHFTFCPQYKNCGLLRFGCRRK